MVIIAVLAWSNSGLRRFAQGCLRTHDEMRDRGARLGGRTLRPAAHIEPKAASDAHPWLPVTAPLHPPGSDEIHGLHKPSTCAQLRPVQCRSNILCTAIPIFIHASPKRHHHLPTTDTVRRACTRCLCHDRYANTGAIRRRKTARMQSHCTGPWPNVVLDVIGIVRGGPFEPSGAYVSTIAHRPELLDRLTHVCRRTRSIHVRASCNANFARGFPAEPDEATW